MSEDLRAMLFDAAEAVPSEEACGLLVGVRDTEAWTVTRAVPCENTLSRERRARRFQIDPRRVIEEERAARGTDEDVIGFYHSHPVGEAVPSHLDREFMALWPDAVWVIVAAESNGPSLRAWMAGGSNSDSPDEWDVAPTPTRG